MRWHVSGKGKLSVRILMALPYGPSQTRIRSRMLLTELARRHQITLVGLAWNQDDVASLSEWSSRLEQVVIVPHQLREVVSGFARFPRLPLQYSIARSSKMAGTIRRLITADETGGRAYDAIHIEHLRGAAAAALCSGLDGRIVFDSVDCIAELARLARRFGPSVAVRLAARAEEWSTRRLESRLVSVADFTTVVAERDRTALIRGGAEPSIRVIPNGVVSRVEPVPLTTSPTIVFSGKLSYHANDAALRWFVANVWPRVRSAVPGATFLVVGANAPEWLHQNTREVGIVLVENPRQIEPWIEQARVAIAPVLYSVGVQNKILEALGRGVPVVATRSAAEGLPVYAAQRLLIADAPDDFAAHVVRLLDDWNLASRLGQQGHQVMRRHFDWSCAVAAFEQLYERSPEVESVKVA